ncbi:CBS domain-containing protein [Desulfovibrio aminophilus]|nr:CBS domain-containing protein [Desulfovibrio aminophilus]MCM0754845.1 CBS domain-containing protein [Desulfovibrio aminophilus]
MLVSAIYSRDVTTIPADESLGRVLCLMPGIRSRLVYVIGADGSLVGVVSSYDLLKVMLPEYLDANLAKSLSGGENLFLRAFAERSGTPVSEIMSTELISCSPEDTVVEVNALIREKGVNVLPVVDKQGVLLGEVARRDILNAVAKICCATS